MTASFHPREANILRYLLRTQRSHNVNEIADETNMAWNTTKKYLDRLESKGYVESTHDQYEKHYKVPDSVIEEFDVEHREHIQEVAKLSVLEDKFLVRVPKAISDSLNLSQYDKVRWESKKTEDESELNIELIKDEQAS